MNELICSLNIICLTILLGFNISINFKHISSDIPSPDDLVSKVSFFLVQVAAMLALLRGRENIYVHDIGQILQKEEEWRYIFCAFYIKQCKSCVFLEKVIQNRWLKTQLNKTNCKYLFRYLLVFDSNYLLSLIDNSYIWNLCWLAS